MSGEQARKETQDKQVESKPTLPLSLEAGTLRQDLNSHHEQHGKGTKAERRRMKRKMQRMRRKGCIQREDNNESEVRKAEEETMSMDLGEPSVLHVTTENEMEPCSKVTPRGRKRLRTLSNDCVTQVVTTPMSEKSSCEQEEQQAEEAGSGDEVLSNTEQLLHMNRKRLRCQAESSGGEYKENIDPKDENVSRDSAKDHPYQLRRHRAVRGNENIKQPNGTVSRVRQAPNPYSYKYLAMNETVTQRYVALCEVCSKPYRSRKLARHLRDTHKKDNATAKVLVQKALQHKRLVLLTATPINGRSIGKFVPEDVVEEMRRDMMRGSSSEFNMKQQKQKSRDQKSLRHQSPQPFLAVNNKQTDRLARRKGKALASQVATSNNLAQLKESFPKLNEVLNNFHVYLLQIAKTAKGRESANRSLNDIQTIVWDHLSDTDKRHGKHMDIPQVLRVLNQFLTSHRLKSAGIATPDTSKRTLISVAIFVYHIHRLELMSYAKYDRKPYVHSEELVPLPLQAASKLHNSPAIASWLAKVRQVALLNKEGFAIPAQLLAVAPSRSNAMNLGNILMTMIGIETGSHSLALTTFNMESFRKPQAITKEAIWYKITGEKIWCYILVSKNYARLLQTYVHLYRPWLTQDKENAAPVFVSPSSSTTEAQALLPSTADQIASNVICNIAKIPGCTGFTFLKFRLTIITYSQCCPHLTDVQKNDIMDDLGHFPSTVDKHLTTAKLIATTEEVSKFIQGLLKETDLLGNKISRFVASAGEVSESIQGLLEDFDQLENQISASAVNSVELSEIILSCIQTAEDAATNHGAGELFAWRMIRRMRNER
ncbi:uncharacterized protein LOC108665546 [Hyalella azteca]|uniref:Uncharacterized protein LOC108665546 n=1 Tax=Hyalella azteca TaxID=294128 RepID=A0A8B7N1U4_HYAAZ|nr:uncharacterized protein LOC108665546 [Hyalella azteca]